MFSLRLRWALRDIKARWIQVAGISFMIALGTGMYAGLTSTYEWRIASNEASFELTNIYDVRARLVGNSMLPRGQLSEIANRIDGIEAISERLIFETQIEVDDGSGTLFVPSRIVGVELADDGPRVNRVAMAVGRPIDESEFGEAVVLLERNFGIFYDLPEEGQLQLGTGLSAEYVGHAMSPEYFIIVEGGSLFGQANLAVLFTSIETAQAISGNDGMINDLVVTVDPSANVNDVAATLRDEIELAHQEISVQTSTREDDPGYRALTQDPEGDQQFYNVFAVVLFAGAAFAALNFSARIVETQRREIGIAMAMGMNPVSIAIRPMLIGVQIAVLGVLFGIGMGWLISQLMAGVIEQFLVLPIYITTFQYGLFARVAAIGFLLPILAVLWPVIRAVRVQPVDAIRTGHLASRSRGLEKFISRLPLPGSTLARMPFSSLLRAPRRTLLTLLSLTAVIAILFSVVGMRDSFIETLNRGDEELLGTSPDRLIVRLDYYYQVDSPEVTALIQDPALQSPEPILNVDASISKDMPVELVANIPNDDALAIDLQFIDFQSTVWRPAAVGGVMDVGTPGIVLARKAASDLNVAVGDHILLKHPTFDTSGAVSIAATELTVLAIHPHPLRTNAYIHIDHLGLMGMPSLTNSISATPAPGLTLNDVKRELFGSPGVATVQGVAEAFEALSDLFEQVAGIFLVIELFVIGLAMLIAFNTANINSEERARDHATMFAFGINQRRALLNLAVEGLTLGILATVLGILLGYALLLWIIISLVPESYPDLGILLTFNPFQTTLILTLSILAITLAPTLNFRKLQKMNIPATLRVQE